MSKKKRKDYRFITDILKKAFKNVNILKGKRRK
jgi:hypothetical protein